MCYFREVLDMENTIICSMILIVAIACFEYYRIVTYIDNIIIKTASILLTLIVTGVYSCHIFNQDNIRQIWRNNFTFVICWIGVFVLTKHSLPKIKV